MNRVIRVGSLFSGIGGFDLAAERAGLTVAWQSEIDPFASRVLAHRFAGVPNLGDIRTLSYGVPAVDVLCGGFPCQDVSVAGLRAGLAGERSGLFWEIARLAADLRPTWLLLENVPGLLSSNEGRDMGAILWALGQLGYGYAYRVLDAQFFGVPQRRRRVFIVACAAGNVRRAAAVLFEPEGSTGDSPPRRASGEDVAYALAASVRGTGDGHGNAWNTTYSIQLANGTAEGPAHWEEIAPTLRRHPSGKQDIAVSVASGQPARYGKGTTSDADDTLIWDQAQITSKANQSRVEPGLPSPPCAATGQLMVAFDDPRRFDNRHGGSGEHRDIHPTLESINPKTLVANTLRASDGHHGFSSPRGDGGDNQVVAGQCHGSNVGEMGTLRGSSGLTSGVPFVAAPLTAGGHPNSNMPGRHREDDENLVAFDWQASAGNDHSWRGKGRQHIVRSGDYAGAVSATRTDAVSGPAVGVRRLTPVECERLQGLPDGFTCLFDHPQPCDCSDGPRYRALGNAVAVPVAAWILRRVAALEVVA